jgi:hypothetical protein
LIDEPILIKMIYQLQKAAVLASYMHSPFLI